MLRIPVSADGAGDSDGISWISGIRWVSGVGRGRGDWDGNAAGSVPGLSGGAGDTGDSIIVGRRWTAGHTSAIIVDGISTAVSARSAKEEESVGR